MSAFLVLFAVLSMPVIGLFIVRVHDQRQRDHERKTYVLHNLATLELDNVLHLLRSLSGDRSRSTLVGEVWVTATGFQFRLKVPWQRADHVMGQLQAHLPSIRYTHELEPPRCDWTQAVELRMTTPGRPLRIYASTAASILGSIRGVATGETVMIQTVFAPTPHGRKPLHGAPSDRLTQAEADRDEIQDRRSKLDEPTFKAVMRVAAVAETPIRARHLIAGVKGALGATETHGTRFEKRLISSAQLQKRLDDPATPLTVPMLLNATELAALLAWPVGNPQVPGLPPRLSRVLQVPDSLARDGRIIGTSNMPGNERFVALAYADATKHVHVMGPTSSGKTTLLENGIKQDIEHGHGVIVIESKGDLFWSTLNNIPKGRMQDVFVLDFADSSFPVGFNILDQGNPHQIVDELVGLFEHLYGDNQSVWTKEVLYFGLHTLIATPGSTFLDLAPLLSPTAEQLDWSRKARDAAPARLKAFWQNFENQARARQDQIVQPVMDRIWQLTVRPELRNIIGQRDSSFQMADVIRGNKILLVNLQGLGKDTANLTGTLVMDALWRAAKDNPMPDKPNFLYLDEMQRFLKLPVDPEDMLATARSLGLGMNLAHQHLGQLPASMRQAVLSNARTKIVFQTAADDASVMSREFGDSVDAQDFLHLQQFETIARIATGGNVSTPVSLNTLPPSKGYGLSREVRAMSQGKYGRPVQQVAEEIDGRYQAKRTSARPAIGSVGNA